MRYEKFLFLYDSLDTVDVVIKPEYWGNEQEGLPYVYQKTIGHVLDSEDLEAHHDDASND